MSHPVAKAKPPFIGLTGGIGAGKSTALAVFAAQGAAVLSTDQVVHDLYAEPEIVTAVVEYFGKDVAPAGKLDRSALAALVFASEADREWLEKLFWPKVVERVADWQAGFAHLPQQPRALVVEVPLLFEAGLEDLFDCTVAVTASDDVCGARLKERGQVADRERIERQLSQAEKSALSDYTIRNDGLLPQLEQSVVQLLAEIAPVSN